MIMNKSIKYTICGLEMEQVQDENYEKSYILSKDGSVEMCLTLEQFEILEALVRHFSVNKSNPGAREYNEMRGENKAYRDALEILARE